jgi:hypothetical protein
MSLARAPPRAYRSAPYHSAPPPQVGEAACSLAARLDGSAAEARPFLTLLLLLLLSCQVFLQGLAALRLCSLCLGAGLTPGLPFIALADGPVLKSDCLSVTITNSHPPSSDSQLCTCTRQTTQKSSTAAVWQILHVPGIGSCRGRLVVTATASCNDSTPGTSLFGRNASCSNSQW